MKDRHGDSGQSLVEFALAAPILILLIAGIVELAGAWRAYQKITDIAREVARNAVASGGTLCESGHAYCSALASTATKRDTLEAIAIGLTDQEVLLDPANLTFDVTPNDVTGSASGSPIRVDLEYAYRLIGAGGVLKLATGRTTVDLKTRITMRKEYAPPVTP